MKTQLLEDIGESLPQPDIPPPNDAPAAGDEQQPSLASAAPPASSRRAGTWRQRNADSGASAEPPVAAPRRPPPPERPLFRPGADPLADVWAVANPETGPTWFQRRGRRTVAWTGALAAVLLMAGGAAWLYRESTTDQALASLASATQHTTALRAALRYVQPIDVAPSELALERPRFIAELPDFAPTPEPVKRVRKPIPVIAKVVRKAPPPPPPRPDPAKVRADRMAETLRQCRAAGYHAEACVKRGCVATPYGIACKG
jgi:hypothetical protein